MPLFFHEGLLKKSRSRASTKRERNTNSTSEGSSLKRKYTDYEEEEFCDCTDDFAWNLPIASPISSMEDVCDSFDQKVKRIKPSSNLINSEFSFGQTNQTIVNNYINMNYNTNNSELDILNTNYERVEKIEEDEYAEYYRVTRKYDHKFCKLILLKNNSSGDDIYKLLSLRNSNIVEITHCGLIGKRPFLETKWYRDGTLDQLLKRGEFISENSLTRMASSLLDSLLFIQENNIVCRDFRPSNILVERHGAFEYDLKYNLEFICFSSHSTESQKRNIKSIGQILFMLMTRKSCIHESITREYLLENISGVYSPKIVDLVLVLLFSDLTTCEIFQFLN